MPSRLIRKFCRIALGAVALLGAVQPAQALTFVFDFTPGTSVAAQNGFIAAGNRWSTLFNDNVTLTMTVGTANLGSGILAQAGSSSQLFSYSAFRAALAADALSANDATAVASLDPGASFNLLINRTSDNPNGSGSAVPYVDAAGANNQLIDINTANAKALGLNPTLGTVGGNCIVACDAFIQFNNTISFDFDPGNGITGGQFDFVGIATHEIGHALGFSSGVDVLDFNSPPLNGPFLANQFTFVSPLDMFRYSAQSTALGAIDWTADTRNKYLSLDGGITAGARFATGTNFGDGRQASHFKDNLGLGTLDPTAAPGELLVISSNDTLAFDVIGWNLAGLSAPVPEPATWLTMMLGFGMIASVQRKRSPAYRMRAS